jgi:hypothetical protein
MAHNPKYTRLIEAKVIVKEMKHLLREITAVSAP